MVDFLLKRITCPDFEKTIGTMAPVFGGPTDRLLSAENPASNAWTTCTSNAYRPSHEIAVDGIAWRVGCLFIFMFALRFGHMRHFNCQEM